MLRLIFTFATVLFYFNSLARADICSDSYRIKYYHDLNREFKASQAYDHLDYFSDLKNSTINLGYTAGYVWVLVEKRVDNAVENCLIEFANPQLDKITSYLIDNSSSMKKSGKAGDSLEFSQRPIKHRNFVLNLNDSTLYRLKSGATMTVPISITTLYGFIPRSEFKTLILGIFYGLMLLIVLYGIISYYVTRNHGFLFYSSFAFFTLWFFIEKDGFAYQYLWTNNTIWQAKGVRLVSYFASSCGVLYYTYFLNDSLNKIIRYIAYLHASLCFLSVLVTLFLPASSTPYLTILLTIFGTLLMISISIFAYIKQNIFAKFFVASSFIHFLGLIVYSFSVTNVIPMSYISEYSMQLSCGIDFILLTIVLNKKIMILNNRENKFKNLYFMKSRVSHDVKLFIDNIRHYFEKASSNSPEDVIFLQKNKKFIGQQIGSLEFLIEEFNKAGFSTYSIKKESTVICELVANLAREQRKGYELLIDDEIPTWEVNVDRMGFMIAFTNILSNARRYVVNKKGGKIWIKFSRKKNYILVCIGNNFSYIEDKIKDKIFEPFLHLDDETSNDVSNFSRQGVGLSNAKDVIESHAGNIWFKSNNKLKHVEFFVKIPVEIL